MGIGAVAASVSGYGWASSINTKRNEASNPFSRIGSATKESTSSNDGKTIGLTTVGNQGYLAKYADSSTPDNPIIKVGDYEVSVNDVDPNNATELEMFALLSYMDDAGLTERHGMASFSKMRAFASQAEYNGDCSGIYDENAFWDKKQNWNNIMGSAKNTFAGIPAAYSQALLSEKLMSYFAEWSNKMAISQSQEKGKSIGDFSEKEWDKLIEKTDKQIEKIKEAVAEEVKETQETKEKTEQSELDYYKSLCKEFKDITFRLEDKQTAMAGGNQMGYGGSMNQIGNGFGNLGKCSISIDISVIRKMQSDPEYERQVKGIIDSTQYNYSNYEQAAVADGFSYMCVNLEDENGKIVRSKTNSHVPFSTEEEVKKLWSGDVLSEKMARRFETMENDLLDTFLSFVEGTKIKSEHFYAKA